jgi:putative radical SAM enzyme (TIGR03279 family)
MVRVETVRRNSIGADLTVPPGTLLLQLNGHELRDALDLAFYEADERVVLDAVLPNGDAVEYEIEKDPGESLGIVPEPDKVRRCTNACPFCFVKGNPKVNKLRAALYVKDDDYRLSFMFGHYVTLTNLREDEWQRIFEQRLSPLYVSVHATDPAARLAMLRNPRSADISAHLDRLADGRIQVHAQVVLCPGINDGPVLQRTIDDLWKRGDSVLSLSVVPVGLTAYNDDRGVRQLTEPECRDALERIESVRRRALEERGAGWCYAADELFLQAGVAAPGAAYFDDRDLVANGVGAISTLRDLVRRDLDGLPSLAGQRIVLVTGTSMADHLGELASRIAASSGALIDTVPVANTLYGPLVTTAGLLSGADHLRALAAYASYDMALFSRSALNDGELFLDDISLAELREAFPDLKICPSEHVTDVLRAA